MSFAWIAPEVCPDATSVRGRIEQRLGGSTDIDDHRITVTVTADGDSFIARVELDDAERTLTGTSCDELSDAVAVIVARLASERRVEPVRVVAPPPPPAPPAPPPPVEVPSAWHLGARASGVSALGILPGLGVGAEIVAVLERTPWSAEVGGLQWASRSQMADSFGSDHFDVGLRVAVLRFGWRIGDWPLRVTAGAELGSMTGQGTETGSGTWLALGAGAQGWWQVTPRLRVVGSAEADVARDRVRFRLNDGTVAYEPSVGSIRAAIGLEVGFR